MRAQAGPDGVPTWDGTYRVAFAGQTLDLHMTSGPDGVVGRLVGPTVEFVLEGEVEVDEDGEASVEGVMSGGGAQGLFSFFPDEDGDFGLLVTPLAAGNRPATEQATYYAVSRAPASSLQSGDRGPQGPPGNAVGAMPGAATTPAGHPLVGTWLTQVNMVSPEGGVSTQLGMEFRGDGTLLELGSRAMGGFPGGHIDVQGPGGGEQAAWRTEGDVLWVSYQGSQWLPLARFRIDGSRLALTYVQDGSIQLWYRQGR